jgi:O-acetyl-ADP-ribose deacetylase (regulator of RNase III)
VAQHQNKEASNTMIIFTDTNDKVIKALADEFADMDVVCQVGSIADVKGAPIVATAGNSFGIMDGGVDLAVRDWIGTDVETKVQETINEYHGGLLVVGSAITVHTNKLSCPYLIYAPTMITPGSIKGTPNVYLAFTAILAAHKQIGSLLVLACPGLGTLTGKVPVATAAKQMRLAYDHFRALPETNSWESVTTRMNELKAIL